MHTTDTLARAGRSSAFLAAPLGLVSLLLVIAAESSGAMASMDAPLAIAASAAGLLSAVTLLLGLLWLHRATLPAMGNRGGGAMVAAVVGAALVVGATWSLVFVAPAFDARFPGLLVEPLPSVVAGYLASHTVLGVGVLLWAVTARRTGAVPRGIATTLIVGGLLCIAPLPARSLVVAIGVLLVARSAAAREPASIPTA